jgi:hypothetical protein
MDYPVPANHFVYIGPRLYTNSTASIASDRKSTIVIRMSRYFGLGVLAL